MSVEGKVVVVTGGAKGIGRWVAKTFAKEGARLAIADVAPMETVVGEVRALGAEAIAVRTDVCVEDEVRSLMDQGVPAVRAHRRAHQRRGHRDALPRGRASLAPHPPTWTWRSSTG